MEDIPVTRRSARIAALAAAASPTPGVQRGLAANLKARPRPKTTTNPIEDKAHVNVSEVENAIRAFQIEPNKPTPERSTVIIPPSGTGNVLRQDSNNNTDIPKRTPANHYYMEKVDFEMENHALLKNFDAGNCQFCYVDLGANDGIMLRECLHVFCSECLQSAIENSDAVVIACPVSYERKCNGVISDAEIKELVRPEIYQEYVDRSLMMAKKKMKNVFSCQTEGCSSWVEFEPGRKTFNCPICKKTNCMECKAIHTGVDCQTYKMLFGQGQLSKVEEIMEKESKNGWEQLIAHMNSSGDSGLNVEGFLAKTDIISNTMEFECPICFTDIPRTQGVILHECLHMFCRECLIHLVEHNDDATVKCPYIDGNYSCIEYMQPREIKALVPKPIYEKHLQRSVKLGESSSENSFHCKTPDCPGWCIYDAGVKRFTCPSCLKNNCIACNAIHDCSCEDYKNRIQQNVNDKLSEEAVEKLVQTGEYMRCPKCKIPVQKTAGCDWLQCSSCKTEICWATRGPRWGPRGHGDTSGGCKCKVNGKKCHPKCGNCH